MAVIPDRAVVFQAGDRRVTRQAPQAAGADFDNGIFGRGASARRIVHHPDHTGQRAVAGQGQRHGGDAVHHDVPFKRLVFRQDLGQGAVAARLPPAAGPVITCHTQQHTAARVLDGDAAQLQPAADVGKIKQIAAAAGQAAAAHDQVGDVLPVGKVAGLVDPHVIQLLCFGRVQLTVHVAPHRAVFQRQRLAAFQHQHLGVVGREGRVLCADRAARVDCRGMDPAGRVDTALQNKGAGAGPHRGGVITGGGDRHRSRRHRGAVRRLQTVGPVPGGCDGGIRKLQHRICPRADRPPGCPVPTR